jgi:hypothetical protein
MLIPKSSAESLWNFIAHAKKKSLIPGQHMFNFSILSVGNNIVFQPDQGLV